MINHCPALIVINVAIVSIELFQKPIQNNTVQLLLFLNTVISIQSLFCRSRCWSKNDERKLSSRKQPKFCFSEKPVLSLKEYTELLDPRRILNRWIVKIDEKIQAQRQWIGISPILSMASMKSPVEPPHKAENYTRVLENMSSCITILDMFTLTLSTFPQSRLYALSNWCKSVEKRVIPTYRAQQLNCFAHWYAVVPFQITVETKSFNYPQSNFITCRLVFKDVISGVTQHGANSIPLSSLWMRGNFL